MKRRKFLKNSASISAIAALTGAGCASLRSAARESIPSFSVLSQTGSSRATAYPETSKIVTLGRKTHVAWLDSEGDRFLARVRTLDRREGLWGPVVTLGEAFDNHGGPALAADEGGHLHAVWYPHHHPFRHRRSTRPNDASEWGPESPFGEKCTYPTLVAKPDGGLLLTCREWASGPWGVSIYEKPPDGEWSRLGLILLGIAPVGYAHFQEALAWGPDFRTLHLTTRIFDGNPGRGHTVGYMRSRDFGRTWERWDGSPIELPARPETITQIEEARHNRDAQFRCGTLAVSRDGIPHVVYSGPTFDPGHPQEAWLAWPKPGGTWWKRSLSEVIAADWPGWALTMPGGIAFTGDGGLKIVLTMVKPEEPTPSGLWGHPTCEIVAIEGISADGELSWRLLSDRDALTPHWLPNIEKPTGFNEIHEPGILYTSGTRGPDNETIVSNEVCWAV